jgi:hypothetical protein
MRIVIMGTFGAVESLTGHPPREVFEALRGELLQEAYA